MKKERIKFKLQSKIIAWKSGYGIVRMPVGCWASKGRGLIKKSPEMLAGKV